MISKVTVKNQTISLQLKLNVPLNFRFDIVSVNGQLVKSEKIGGLQAGIHTMDVALDKIPSGLYLMQCSGNGFYMEPIKVNHIK